MAVHRGGTLAAASRALRQDATTVGRRISALETSAGGPLFVRTSTGWRLSELGRAVQVQAEAMEAAALDLERAVVSQSAAIQGTLRLACLASFAAEVLAPWLFEFCQRHPGVDLELVTSASLADLCRRDADVAVRFLPQSPSFGGGHLLLARKVAVAHMGLYASETYLGNGSIPKSIEDLSAHAVIGRDERGVDVPGYRWLTELERDHKPTIALRCNPFPATRAAVEAGFGIGAMPIYTGEASRDLVRVLPDVEFGARSIWLVVHRDLRKVARVGALLDFLASKFMTF